MPEGAASIDRARDLARYYDLDLAEDQGDVDLYRALARRTGGPVLELGVGTGRLAIPIAMDGFDVTGVDFDEAMLERAAMSWQRQRRGGTTRTLQLVTRDLLELELGPRFGLAYIALNTLLLMSSRERQLGALRALTRHLRRGGVAVVDVWLPGPDDLALYDGRLLREWSRDDPETASRVAKSVSARYEPATRLVELETFFDAWPTRGGGVRRTKRSDRLRLVGAEELQRLAREAGLAVEALGADYEMATFGPEAERVVLVAGLV